MWRPMASDAVAPGEGAFSTWMASALVTMLKSSSSVPSGRTAWDVARTLEPHQLQVLLAAGDPTATQAAPLWRRVGAAS